MNSISLYKIITYYSKTPKERRPIIRQFLLMSSCELLRVRGLGEKPPFAHARAAVILCKLRTTVIFIWRPKGLVTS